MGPAVGALLVGLAAWALKMLNAVHLLVNSQKVELERQVSGLRTTLTVNGVEIPPHLEPPGAVPPG